MGLSVKYFRVIFLCGLLLQDPFVNLCAADSPLEQQQVVEFMTENAQEISMLDALYPQPAILSNGNVAVLMSNADVSCTLYNKSGVTVREAFLVNVDGAPVTRPNYFPTAYWCDVQLSRAIASFHTGGFVIAWHAITNNPGGQWNVRVRIFDNDGVPQTDEIFVTPRGPYNSGVAVTVLHNDNFVVGWIQQSDGGIYAKILNKQGDVVTPTFPLTTGPQKLPAFAALETGFVAVWNNNAYNQISGRVYADNGNKLGPSDFQVSPGGSSQSIQPDIAAITGGGFVVCWQYANGIDAAQDVGCEIHDEAGGIIASFPMNLQKNLNQAEVSVAEIEPGLLVVAWHDELQANGIRIRGVNKNGLMLNQELLIDSGADGFPVISGGSGNLFVTYRKGSAATLKVIPYSLKTLVNANNVTCSAGYSCLPPNTDYCTILGSQCVNPNTYCPSGKNCINSGADYCATSGSQCVNPNTYSPPGKNCINSGVDYCATSGNQCLNPNTYCPTGKNCINSGTDYCATSGNQCVNPSIYCPSGKNCINSGTDYCATSGYQCVNPNTYCSSGKNCGSSDNWMSSWGGQFFSGIGGAVIGAVLTALIKKHCESSKVEPIAVKYLTKQ